MQLKLFMCNLFARSNKHNATKDTLSPHLRFKQAQPKMCHPPKVEDGLENQFSMTRSRLGPLFSGNLFV